MAGFVFGEGLLGLVLAAASGTAASCSLHLLEYNSGDPYIPDADDSFDDVGGITSYELNASGAWGMYASLGVTLDAELDTDNDRVQIDLQQTGAAQDFTFPTLGAGESSQKQVQGCFTVLTVGADSYLWTYHRFAASLASSPTTNGCDFVVPTFELTSDNAMECGDIHLPYGESTGSC